MAYRGHDATTEQGCCTPEYPCPYCSCDRCRKDFIVQQEKHSKSATTRRINKTTGTIRGNQKEQ